jgi:murein DD-endopeptidase MepM/ murein hydrolase activator NlpD
VRTLIAVVLTCFLASPCAEAATKTKKRRASKPKVYTVKPSEEIEQRVDAESERAKAILDSFTEENLFESPYLTAAIYYHDGFLSGFPDEKPEADPARRIVGRLQRDLTVEKKAQYVGLLLQYWCETAPYSDAPPDRFVVPVPYEPPPAPPPKPRKKLRWRRARRGLTHEFAVDLFTNEGTRVLSFTRGVVVLADRDWDPAQPFSTTSQKGGNSVIIFDPDAERFLRYAHLDQVFVKSGDTMHAGDRLGTVGHTGLNASLPRHGRHVHWEVNQFEQGRTRPLKAAELWNLIHGREHGGIEAP